MTPQQYAVVKLESANKLLSEALETITGIEEWDGKFDIKRLLGDEGYRVEVARSITKSNAEAAKLLNVSERSIYRFLNRAEQPKKPAK